MNKTISNTHEMEKMRKDHPEYFNQDGTINTPRIYKYYNMEQGENINQDLANLPIAKEAVLYTNDSVKGMSKIDNFKAIQVISKSGTTIVHVPRNRYTIVQHIDAFRPIIEGLTLAGQKHFGYVLYNTASTARLQIYIAGEAFDTVSLGFEVTNSFDGTTAVNYGLKMNKSQTVIELVGYRQVCSNGMKIRVPLDQAELIRPELKTKIQELMNDMVSIRHTVSAKDKIKQIQYVVEAMTLLREPAELLIRKAKKFDLKDKALLDALVKAHVSKRMKSKVLEQYAKEEDSIWGLYNAITFVASHNPDLRIVSRDNMLGKGADLLLDAIKVKV